MPVLDSVEKAVHEVKKRLQKIWRARMRTSSNRLVRSYTTSHKCLWSSCATCCTRWYTLMPKTTVTNKTKESRRTPFHLHHQTYASPKENVMAASNVSYDAWCSSTAS